jgi:hypothetical protein
MVRHSIGTRALWLWCTTTADDGSCVAHAALLLHMCCLLLLALIRLLLWLVQPQVLLLLLLRLPALQLSSPMPYSCFALPHFHLSSTHFTDLSASFCSCCCCCAAAAGLVAWRVVCVFAGQDHLGE